MLHMVGQRKELGVQEVLYLYLNARTALVKRMSVLIEKPASQGAKFMLSLGFNPTIVECKIKTDKVAKIHWVASG